MNIVAHNLLAMNANRQLGITTKNKAKSIEKLSSGFRINRAADDAAGLAISEKMRRQIRGLNQGIANAQDGVSLCQVADGALAEVDEMLHRITELSVKAANETNTKDDREAIQLELGELLDEIDIVGRTTTFNERNLFTGETFYSDKLISTQEGLEQLKGATAPTAPADIEDSKGNVRMSQSTANDLFKKMSEYVKSKTTSDAVNDEKQLQLLEDMKALVGADAVSSQNETMQMYSNMLRDVDTVADFYTYLQNLKEIPMGDDGIWIQAGAEAHSGMRVEIDGMNTGILGIGDLDVTTTAGANRSIDRTKEALSKVALTRSKIGAQQNRLEHAIANERNIVENTTAAESAIRDTNMAQEMVQLSKDNILEQVGQAMLAQANQSSQGVLSLLQG